MNPMPPTPGSMPPPRGSRRAFAAAAAGAIAALAASPVALAQQQVVKPPIAQYWMDVSTSTMAGMPEMPGMPSISSMMGGGAGSGTGHYGAARAGSLGRYVDLALYTRNRPAGTEGTHTIPAGMKMGPNLPLVPYKPPPTPPRERDDWEPPENVERPKGRILIYWGCGEAVRPGQPRVIDLASASPMEFGKALGGRYAPDRGARIGPGYSLWPNEKNRLQVPRDASLVGDHAVGGEGVPPSLKFAIGQMQDLMPAIDLASTGTLADSVALKWSAMPQARAWFLHAMGTKGNDMILWSSSETPDTGMGVIDYLSNATLANWLRDKVLLPAAQTQCAVPKGIFAGGESAMLRMIAYGEELNLAHPPRPTDPKIPWEPDWSLRVRVKSLTMAMLGEDIDRSAGGGGRRGATAAGASQPPADASAGQPPAEQAGKAAEPAKPSGFGIPGLPGLPGGAVDVLRGVIGR